MSKKAFQSNADRPFAHSTSYIVDKVEHVLRGWGTRDLYSQVLSEKVLTCPWGGGGWD